MTEFLLIRHGETDWVGKSLAGRIAGIPLNDAGKAQAQRLTGRLERIDVLYSSPLDRCIETALPLATARSLEILRDTAFNEIDFGEWSGQTFEVLAGDPAWNAYNAFREIVPAPGGESMLDVQARVIGALHRLEQQHPNSSIAIVTHADVIRAALAQLLGMPLGNLLRLRIDPASISRVGLAAGWAEVVSINHVE